MESFLFEMPVIGQNIHQFQAAHGLHRNAVWKAVSLVRPGCVQFEAGAETFVSLRQDIDRRIAQDMTDDRYSLIPKEWTFAAKEGEELGEDFFRRDQRRPLLRSVKGNGGGVTRVF
jgi:hypothetical protein